MTPTKKADKESIRENSPQYAAVTNNNVELPSSFRRPGNRRGVGFCICCCDMRRAVIAVNIFVIVDTVLSIMFQLLSDDTMLLDAADSVVIGVVRLTLSSLALYGAMTFKRWAILPNILVLHICFLFFLLYFILQLFRHDDDNIRLGLLLDLIILGFQLYPHIMFLEYLENGIMSPATYHYREAHSCCCLTPAEIDAKNAAARQDNNTCSLPEGSGVV